MDMTPKQIVKYKGCMSFFKTLTLSTLCLSTLTADTVFEAKVFNVFTEKLDAKIYRVSDSLIRTDKLKDKKKFYSVIETKEQQKYLINTEKNETTKDPLHKRTTYNDKSTLELAGDVKALIGGKYSSKRYQFKAKGKVCNHIYIAQLDNPDAKVFNESFTIVPTKLAGMRISDYEKSCQKAARDAAKEIKKIGIPLLITGKDDNFVLFKVTAIKEAKFDKKIFDIPNKEEALSFKEQMKKGMDKAFEKFILEKLVKHVGTLPIPTAEKEKITKEAGEAYDKGKLKDYVSELEKKYPRPKKKEQKAFLDANVQNIAPAKIENFMVKNTNEKPVLVHFRTRDKACRACKTSNKALKSLSSRYASRMDFVSVDFYPWKSMKTKENKVLLHKYAVKRLPMTMIVYKNKILAYTQKLDNSKGVTMMNDALSFIKENRNMDMFTSHIEPGSIYKANANKSAKRNYKKYIKYKGFKAMALVIDEEKDTWRSSWAYMALGQKIANEKALVRCEEIKAEKKLNGKCKLSMIDNYFVYNKSKKDIDTLTNEMSTKFSPLDDALERFKKKKDFKTFAMAKSKNGFSWSWNISYGYKTQEEADKKALTNCEKKRKKRNKKYKNRKSSPDMEVCKIIKR